MPGKNLFMSLPAELRNNIYDLVLLKRRRWVGGQSARNRHVNDDRVWVGPDEYWSEPALLSISHEIRTEAASAYYKSNKFIVSVTKDDFPPACAWLRVITKLVGTKPFAQFGIAAFSPTWQGLAQVFPLVKLLHDSGLDVSNDYEGTMCSGRQWKRDCICISPRVGVAKALNSAVDLGRRAGQEGGTAVKLEIEFRQWLHEAIMESAYARSHAKVSAGRNGKHSN